MKATHLTGRTGKAIKNQFIIYTPEATYFQSYGSIIVMTNFDRGVRTIYLDANYYNYSKTTVRYRNQFLGMTSKEIELQIKSGEIELIDLNIEE